VAGIFGSDEYEDRRDKHHAKKQIPVDEILTWKKNSQLWTQNKDTGEM